MDGQCLFLTFSLIGFILTCSALMFIYHIGPPTDIAPVAALCLSGLATSIAIMTGSIIVYLKWTRRYLCVQQIVASFSSVIGLLLVLFYWTSEIKSKESKEENINDYLIKFSQIVLAAAFMLLAAHVSVLVYDETNKKVCFAADEIRNIN